LFLIAHPVRNVCAWRIDIRLSRIVIGARAFFAPAEFVDVFQSASLSTLKTYKRLGRLHNRFVDRFADSREVHFSGSEPGLIARKSFRLREGDKYRNPAAGFGEQFSGTARLGN